MLGRVGEVGRGGLGLRLLLLGFGEDFLLPG